MAPENLEQYIDHKVVVVVNLPEPNADGNSAVEVEGSVLAANALGVLLKPKGRTKAELIEVGAIESIKFAPEKARDLKAKSLKVVEYGDARQHLADRHATSVAWVNSATEAAALDFHGTVDHSDLGHNHDPKPAKDESPAAE